MPYFHIQLPNFSNNAVAQMLTQAIQINMARVIKRELIVEVSNKTGIKHQEVTLVIEAFLESIMDHMGQGKAIALRDFGTLDLRVSRRKVGRNPRRPETPIPIPDKHVVRFRPGAKLGALAAAVAVPEGS